MGCTVVNVLGKQAEGWQTGVAMAQPARKLSGIHSRGRRFWVDDVGKRLWRSVIVDTLRLLLT